MTNITTLKSKIILGNWKMNMSREEVKTFFRDFLNLGPISEDTTIGLAVPAPYFSLVSDILNNSNYGILTGSQNVHWEKQGAHTGEISGQMLIDCNVNFSLVAHSERRTHYGETNHSASKRIKSCLGNNLVGVLCVGETREEYESNKTEAVLDTQVRESLDSLQESDTANLVIAYEPVWAIGTGLSATPNEAEQAHITIRKILKDLFPQTEHIPIIYGGSVNEKNATELLKVESINGFLVGGASLKAESFATICKA